MLIAWAHRNTDDELIAAALAACKSGISDIRYR
jgi:hypothetical protein